ncbi:MAG: Single-stranded-DNA-specific exonuclease RecJ [Chlamydiae bacterium]|nr:Single-stranded-DNA-specific exonuclease RecJ [Chlamydiota bacterium]
MHGNKPKAEKPIWVHPKNNAKLKQSIVKEFKLHPVIAQILVSRGFRTFEDIHRFLYSKLPDLHDPYLFNEMNLAVDRICEARKKGEKIIIYGDNDVDGMTGTTLLTEFLRSADVDVIYFVASPSSKKKATLIEALDTALENDCKVLISVDVGITATKEIATFVSKGIDVIVTDHHEPNEVLPKCTALLNPKLPNNTYPDRNLTGVGVAFKLAHGVTIRLVKEGELSPKKIDLKRYLDLVALGTISDMGALIGENRIFVRYGLEQIKKGKRIGLAKLISVCDVNPNELNTFIVASRIGPPLNSLGRIANANDGVKLLLIRNSNQAEKLAQELGLNNIERQKIERNMTEDVENILKNNPQIFEKKAIILASEKWHPGVIPIIATRLSKYYNRPTFIIAINEKFGKGSIRSIPEFPLLPALKQCADLLENFGGHDIASGMIIKEENIPEFTKRILDIANSSLKDKDIKNKLNIDAYVNFEDLTYDCLESLHLLEPHGNENPAPLLFTEAKQAWPPKVIGKMHEKAHLKIYLEQKDRVLEGIALNRAQDSSKMRNKDLKLEVVFTPQIDVFQSQSYLRLLIRDFTIKSEEKKGPKTR